MKQVIHTLKRKDAEKRIPVLKLEIDYELATLHDALTANDESTMQACKTKLNKLRQEMMELEA